MGNHNLEIIGGLFLHIILDGLLYAVVMYRGGWLQYKCSGFNRAGSECLQFCEFSLVTNMSVIELYSGKKERNSLVYLLPRKVWSGGFFFFSPQNLKAASTILLFGAIQNVVRTIEFRKFRIQQTAVVLALSIHLLRLMG